MVYSIVARCGCEEIKRVEYHDDRVRPSLTTICTNKPSIGYSLLTRTIDIIVEVEEI
jgi:hypothetical protein